MHISEAKAARAQAEQQIKKILEDLQTQTGLCPLEVKVEAFCNAPIAFPDGGFFITDVSIVLQPV